MRRVKQTYGSVVRLVRPVQAWVAAHRQYVLTFALALMVAGSLVGTATATQTSSSTNYSVTETQFGSGTIEHQCSTNYCAKSSAGDTTAGSTSSTNYSAQTSSNTTDEPRLDVTVTGGSQDMGVLDNTHTGTATANIDVVTYLTNGYTVQLSGASPTQGVHHITPLATPSTSQQGAEQFGVNMVANTAPAIGTNPTKQPSGASAMSFIQSDYSSADLFKFAEGDILAQDSDASGEVQYTLSMILNVSNVTPSGHYTSSYSVVVVPIY